VGIPLSEEVRKAILPVLSLLSKEKGVKSVSLENLHLTLTFLGDVSEPALEEIKKNLAQAAKTTKPFSVSLSQVGYFSFEGKIRTIWIGVSKEILPLLHHVSAACSTAGDRHKEDVPHITLARVKEAGASTELQKQLKHLVADHQADQFGTMVINNFLLYSSVLTPQGPVYTPLQTFLLA